jgi:hypothetical protein
MVPCFRNPQGLLAKWGMFLTFIRLDLHLKSFHQPYGRNWAFLWSVPIPQWQILILVIVFFIGVWAAMLVVLTHFSKTHTWLLPVFAVGLGAPRWCQMLWGTSSLALYIPWAGSGGPYLGISLWLWLGVLDAVQGVGLGMILLQVGSYRAASSPLLNFHLDLVSPPCLRYACFFPGHWLNLRHGCASYCSKSHWSRISVPRRIQVGFQRWA